ncbi:MAG: murein transglycosylase A [Alphaproteobacteria bacterium]|nr:murein transglycosylase A [Alphaproteobacteria bacterium]MBV9418710.1 murein transglycosylase A [Alphaproteobacteria bacterium]MBV9904655.1 murein transglycosylase A [Alphaproteobacteria bacterium]
MRFRVVIVLFLLLLITGGFATYWFYFRTNEEGPLRLTPLKFADVPGWSEADPAKALAAFRRSCVKLRAKAPDSPMGYAGTARDWQKTCDAADSAHNARAFFATNFTPYAIGGDGLVTGYYEPLLNGSRTRHGKYQTPVYGVPEGLVSVDLGAFRDEWKGEKIAGRVQDGRLLPLPTRAEIDARPPSQTPVLFWGDDREAVFFLHIQGSGRVWLDDGTILRVSYAGQNGHPYTPVGRILIKDYGLPREGMSMQVIRSWLKSHPKDADRVIESDASFVFFSTAPVGDPKLGPVGTEGVPLTPRASVAIDNTIHPLGLPMFLAGDGFADLFIAQDTGGAIRGNARADVFFGFGANAETAAGGMKAHPRFYALLPKTVTPKLPP